jgi:hypothetical protein
LDSINRHAVDKDFAAAQHLRLGLKQPDRPVALEPLHLPQLMGVDK